MSNSSNGCEGPLYLEIGKTWEEYYCIIEGIRFQAHKKVRADVPASKSNKSSVVLRFDIAEGECECKRVKFGLAELAKMKKYSNFTETPQYFSVTVVDTVHMFGASDENERAKWIKVIRTLARPKERRADAWIKTGFLEGNYPQEGQNRFTGRNEMLPSKRQGQKVETPENSGLEFKTRWISGNNNLNSTKDTNKSRKDEAVFRNSLDKIQQFENDKEDRTIFFGFFERPERICWIKIDTLIRFVKVCTAFPFIIVLSALNLSSKYSFLRSMTGIRIMNVIIYVAPVFYVRFVLSEFENVTIQRIANGLYILLYLFPVAYVVFSKVQASSSSSSIEEGTFCFKPARSVRLTQANFYAFAGFVFEWIQHVLYVLPLGVVTEEDAPNRLSNFPPYLSFEIYFWGSIGCTFLCAMIIILNAVMRGKLHYRFQNSYHIWFFVYNVGSPLFVSIVTILFMSLWCDYTDDPPTLVQQPSIECYSDKHIVMARAALIAMAFYIIQHTLLPSGTFKETMRRKELEIMFVPVYLQAHFLLKAIFSWIYVFFYNEDFLRVLLLTLINMVLLGLNNFMKPCSVTWVNTLRDGFFTHAVLAGIQALNYLAWESSRSTKQLLISTLASNMLFSSIGIYVYYKYTARSTEYKMATAFLDLEWQVSQRGGSVHPRVLEPLISLTLSSEEADWEIAKKYIAQLVWLIAYPNMRVKFQSAWALANIALLDEDARVKIHEAGGTKSLFDEFGEMSPVVQLETLAALANLTLSMDVAEEMVTRFKCIPFFMELTASNKLKHAQFACIAVSNLARKENIRELIRSEGGIPILVRCILMSDYQIRRAGARALANMALSSSREIELLFEHTGLIDRILRMALRKEIETQREVVALIRNLSCHARLRPLLLDRGVMNAISVSKLSVFEDVQVWCEEITILLEKEVKGGAIDLKALIRREGAKGSGIGEADVDLLKRMDPLAGQVDWSTWGSKLENIFLPVFSNTPSLSNSRVSTKPGQQVEIPLGKGLSRKQKSTIKDSMGFGVVEVPKHGVLNELHTHEMFLVYTPDEGYSGVDKFTYRLMLSATSQTTPVTVTINIRNQVRVFDEDESFEQSEADQDTTISENVKNRNGRKYKEVDQAKFIDSELGEGVLGASNTRDQRKQSGFKRQSTNNTAADMLGSRGKNQDNFSVSDVTTPSQIGSPFRGETPNRGASKSSPFFDNLMKKTSVHIPRDEKEEEKSSDN